MFKNSITARFRIFSIGSVLGATIASKLLLIAYMWAASDITVSDIFTNVFRFGYEAFEILAIAFAIAVTVYAHSYFGKKTCVSSSLFSLGCLASGKVLMYIYMMLSNELSGAQLISKAFSYTVEILFDGVLILLAILFSFTFAKKRANTRFADPEKKFSPQKSACFAAGAYYFLLIADLSLARVIPFIVKYNDPTLSEIKAIVADYLYYLIALPVNLLFIILAMFSLSKITGRLKLKQYYERKKEK